MGFTITRENWIVKGKVFWQCGKTLLFTTNYAKIGEALSEERDETGGKGQA